MYRTSSPRDGMTKFPQHFYMITRMLTKTKQSNKQEMSFHSHSNVRHWSESYFFPFWQKGTRFSYDFNKQLSKKNVKQSLNEQMDAKMYDWLPKFLHAFSLCLAKFSAFENTTEELSNQIILCFCLEKKNGDCNIIFA